MAVAQAAEYTVPGSFTTIKDAIAAANTNADVSNSILVSANQVITSLNNITKNLTLAGSGATLSVDIDMNGANRFTFAGSGNTYVAENLKIINATNSAISINTNNNLLVENVLFNNNSSADGGAINNNGTLSLSEASFTSNRTTNRGGAIYNNGTVSNIIDSSFQNNTSNTFGGAIFNQANRTISNIINSSFDSNNARSLGGAIFNNGTITTINQSSFTNNSVNGSGGALYNLGIITQLSDSSFSGNKAGQGGAIYLDGTITTINNTVFNANTSNATGGAISIVGGLSSPNIGTINNSVFSNNQSQRGGAIDMNASGIIQSITNTDFNNNKANAQGGAIAVVAGSRITINGNTNFNNNTAATLGGAIFNSGPNLTLTSDSSGDITFSSNTAGGSPNDIHTTGAAVNINGTSGNVILNGGISGTSSINKSNNGGVILGAGSLNNNYTGAYTQTAGTLTTYSPSFFAGVNTISNSNLNLLYTTSTTINNLSLDNVKVNSLNSSITTTTVNNFSLGNGGADFSIDIDGNNRISDKFILNAGSYGPSSGGINISNIIVSGVPTAEIIPLQVFQYTGGITYSESVSQEIKTPVYYYNFGVNGNGEYSLVRAGLNSQILRGQVATLAMYNGQLLVNGALFDHIYLDSEELLAYGRNGNRYASISPLFAPYQYTVEDGSIWAKTYATFEKLSMTHDLHVGNNLWGQIVGLDFPSVCLNDGWEFIPTAFVAYNGGHQTYDGVGMWQNGGQGGVMGTFMRNDFISSIAAYGGGYFNEMSVDGAHDRTGNWFAGAAMKTAYNFHPTRNLVFQPNLLTSYNIFGKQNWGTDLGGISMTSGYLNGINVAPGFNLIYAAETWSIYFTTQYMYYINDKVNGKASDANLPNVRMKHGYIEYGVGAAKTFKDRFMSYIQVVIRNAGRSGVGFQLGFSWIW